VHSWHNVTVHPTAAKDFANRFHGTNLREFDKEVAIIIVGEENCASIDAAQNDMHQNPGGAEADSSWQV